MRAVTLFFVAGILEIGGGYLVWLWLRERQAALLGVLGFIALALYGVVPVLQSRENPFGRIYAAYGAVFIAMSLLWGWRGCQPDRRRDPDVAQGGSGAPVIPGSANTSGSPAGELITVA